MFITVYPLSSQMKLITFLACYDWSSHCICHPEFSFFPRSEGRRLFCVHFAQCLTRECFGSYKASHRSNSVSMEDSYSGDLHGSFHWWISRPHQWPCALPRLKSWPRETFQVDSPRGFYFRFSESTDHSKSLQDIYWSYWSSGWLHHRALFQVTWCFKTCSDHQPLSYGYLIRTSALWVSCYHWWRPLWSRTQTWWHYIQVEWCPS
jgi:hypothetical protein